MPTFLLVFEFLGTTELLVIALVALIIFGPRKLPEIGRKLGQTLSEFKRASEDFKRTWEYEVETERTSSAPRIEAEAAVPRDSLTDGGDDVLVDDVVEDVLVDEDGVPLAPAEATVTTGAGELLPEAQTIARAPSDFEAARAAEPDDDAPNVFESPDPVPGKQ
jgi:sec-independent protein translocase protein TatA